MDTIFLTNLVARGIIGVNDWEREKAQEIVINVELSTDLRKAGRSDNILDSVNYRSIAKKLLFHCETAKRFTVEALAEDLAHICLEDERVHRVIIRLEKPGAIRFADSVGVEIERMRKDLP